MPAIAQLANETRIDIENSDARRKLARLVTRLFELWDLPAADQLELLGLSRTSRAQISRYRKGGGTAFFAGHARSNRLAAFHP